jgi:spoIIIJ-associated protein
MTDAATATSGDARRREDLGAPDEGDMEVAVEAAEEFLRGLLDAFGMTGSLERTAVDEATVEISVVGRDLGLLIGPKGQTLAAVQELTRTVALRRSDSPQLRIFLDVAGYRKARREALARFTEAAARQVLDTGVSRVMEPMPAADRKVVHDTANDIPGVVTTSEGEEPNRRVVILLAPDHQRDPQPE